MHTYGYHPVLGVTIRSDGLVLVPANRNMPAHWSFGSKNDRGYLRVKINGKHYLVHRLVAQTFLHNPKNKPQVDHINRNPSDNRVDNLRWCTNSENNRNRRDNDRVDARGGTHKYENVRQYKKEHRQTHTQDYRMAMERFRKTHKNVHFSDGKQRWVPNSEAILLLAIPLSQRFYTEK